MYEYRARLSHRHNDLNPVYDGDTVWIDIDLGCNVTLHNEKCRLYGINAPEMRGPQHDAGVAARDWLRTKLAALPTFTVRTHKDEKGKYGRWLVELIDADGTNLNQEMVKLGLAVQDYYGHPPGM